MRHGPEHTFSIRVSIANKLACNNKIRHTMQEPVDTATKPKNVTKQLLIAVLALGLLWFAFRGTDLQELWRYAQTVKPLPVIW